MSANSATQIGEVAPAGNLAEESYDAMSKATSALITLPDAIPTAVALDPSQHGESDLAVNALTLATVPLPENMEAPVAHMQAHPVHIYPKAALALLKLKCPAIRNYCNDDRTGAISNALRAGSNRTLASFENGPDDALQASRYLPGFDQQAFDTDMMLGRLPATSCYTCAQARADGSAVCPTGGCVLPDGSTADAPVELLTWDCNIKEVGHAIIAKSVASSEFSGALIVVRDKLFIYSAGVYREVNENETLHKILPHLGPMSGIKLAKDIGNILRISNARRMEAIKPSPDHVCFGNGTLNVLTRQLEAHSPSNMLLNPIEHDYMPAATCPGFLEFLDQTFHGDSDRLQKIELIQQWFGYTFTADTSYQKMMICKGEGANGKSILEELLGRMLGRHNTTGASLHRLAVPHVRASLEGRLLNKAAENSKMNGVADGDTKAIISGDGIEVSPKFKPSYQIEPYVRLMVATNHLPHNDDTSEAYFRRLLILTFNNIVPVEQRNPHLLESLLPEMQGIIAWAIEGLYQLREQGQFTIPPSSIQAIQSYREEISPVRMFAEECLVPSPDRSGFVARDLFMAFRAWCRDRGFDADNMISMGRELSALGFNSRKSGTSIWLVKAKDSAQEYFKPSRILPEPVTPIPAEVVPLQLAA
jgi:putative DNA primase/helicase